MRPRDRDSGSVTLNLVVVFPVFLGLLLLIVQAALYFHARNVALAAAQEGLRIARSYDATAVEGQERAESFLSEVAGGSLSDDRVTATRDDESARVEVAGVAVSVLPGLKLRIVEVAAGPVERFSSSS